MINDNLRLTIPPSTPSTNPQRVTRIYPSGTLITEISLHVPLGHEALQPVWVEMNGGKILPSDGGEYRLDNVPDLPLLRGDQIPLGVTTEIALVGYNLDVEFPHTTSLIIHGRRGAL